MPKLKSFPIISTHQHEGVTMTVTVHAVGPGRWSSSYFAPGVPGRGVGEWAPSLEIAREEALTHARHAIDLMPK